MYKSLGGERLGAGQKMGVDLHNYERSTFDLSRVWRSTMNVGTLIPFFTEIGLNGDTFDIDLSAMMRTVPTQGPLFGSYKLQMDVFATPIRLYNGLLHNNAINIGMDMSRVKLPTIELAQYVPYKATDEKHHATAWSNTCLSAFFNKRGLADIINYDTSDGVQANNILKENVNALPYLCYADIFKQYYANKQEENGKMIISDIAHELMFADTQNSGTAICYDPTTTIHWFYLKLNEYLTSTHYATKIIVPFTKLSTFPSEAFAEYKKNNEGTKQMAKLWKTINIYDIEEGEIWKSVNAYFSTADEVAKYEEAMATSLTEDQICFTIYLADNDRVELHEGQRYTFTNVAWKVNAMKTTLKIQDFPLQNIDDMKVDILKATALDNAIHITKDSKLPYSANCNYYTGTDGLATSSWATYNESEYNGLLLKTYQSDIFNNWLQKEWVDNIATLSAVSTTTGSFTMDSLNLAKKVYDMLNRVAVSGGTYEDWQEAIWGEEAIRRAESPIYYGGASSEIVFEEVISNSASEDVPLGTIGGRGNLKNFNNGKIVIKCEEPMVIMGIVSITPRLDYEDTDNWWMYSLKTMNDLHKPGLDGIGFQDLLARQLTYKARVPELVEAGSDAEWENDDLAIGKQPAWINYQTAVNEVHGEFCDKLKTGWMVLTRNYEVTTDADGDVEADFTTYIDPKKYNYPFAYKELDAQNFWTQIGIQITARRKMSAKQMPNI